MSELGTMAIECMLEAHEKFLQDENDDLLVAVRKEVKSMQDRIATLEAEKNQCRAVIDDLKKNLVSAPSETCRKYHVQNCHVCDNMDCCDNMSEAKRIIAAKDAEIKKLEYVRGYESDLICVRKALDEVNAPHDTEDSVSLEPKRIRLLAKSVDRRVQEAREQVVEWSCQVYCGHCIRRGNRCHYGNNVEKCQKTAVLLIRQAAKE